jgi:hypothetical protein
MHGNSSRFFLIPWKTALELIYGNLIYVPAAGAAHLIMGIATFLQGFQYEFDFLLFDGKTPVAVVTSKLHQVPPILECEQPCRVLQEVYH